tara:strand:- start:957 stop:2174 length:1218 start_codon:yes stop_codon:yes gene_type:complete
MSGTTIASIVGLLVSPILSRLYNPEAFTAFHLYMGFLEITLVFSLLKYDYALYIANKGKELEALIKLIFCISFFVSLTSLIFIFIFKNIIVDFYPSLSSILFLFPLAILIAGIYQVLSIILIRTEEYRLISVSRIARAVSAALASIGFAFSITNGIGLISAEIFSRLFSSYIILKKMKNNLIRSFQINIKELLDVAYKYKEYPLLTMPGALISSINGLMIALVMIRLYDIETAGQYVIVERFILMPLALLAVSASQVFNGDIASHIRKGDPDLVRNLLKYIYRLFLIGLFPSLIFFLLADDLIPLIFGEQWELAGKLAVACTPIVFCRFIYTPLNMVLIIVGDQMMQLKWEILRIVLTIVLFIFLFSLENISPITVAYSYSILVLVVSLLYLLLCYLSVQKNTTI